MYFNFDIGIEFEARVESTPSMRGVFSSGSRSCQNDVSKDEC